MKAIIIIAILSFCSILCATDILSYPAPQFLQSYYDHYSINYLNAVAAGRGNTGIAIMGNIENCLLNPAAFHTDHQHLYMEISVKPTVTEYNQNSLDKQNYASPNPIGMLAYAFPSAHHTSLGISYTQPQSIEYYMLSWKMPTGDYVDRYPSMYVHQIGLTGNYEYGNLHLGMNILNDFYVFHDQIRNDETFSQETSIFNRISFTEYVPRFQPGVMYRWKNLSMGTTYTLPANQTFHSEYKDFPVKLPDILSGGLSYGHKQVTYAVDANYTRCSRMSDDFKDRLTLKAGVEREYNSYIARIGFIHVPSVWDGNYRYLDYTEHEIFENWGHIGKTDQALITGGVTWFTSSVDFTLSFLHDVNHNADFTEVYGSLGINMNLLNPKELFKKHKKDKQPPQDEGDTDIEYMDR